MTQPFDFADLVEEASQRAGGENTTSVEIESLIRSLYLIQQDWMQKNYPTWRVTRTTVGFQGGYPEVDLPEHIDDVIQMNSVVHGSENEQPMRRISADEYARLTTKLTEGRPSQFYLQRSEPPKVFVYPAGRKTETNWLTITYIRRPEEFERLRPDSDVPARWTRALVQALAAELARKRPPYDDNLIQRLDRERGLAEELASRDDRQRNRYRVRI